MSGRLHVLQLCHDYAGPFRSICRQFTDAFADAEVTTLFLCGDENESVVQEVGGDRVEFLERPHRAMRGLKLDTLYLLYHRLKGQRFDLVITHRYRPLYFASILALFLDFGRVLSLVHEHGVFRRFHRRLPVWWQQRVTLVGVSNSVCDDIERDCGALRVRKRLLMLPNVIDPARADDLLPANGARRELGVDGDQFVIGTVGRLVDKKEHDVLIDAFGEISGAHEKVILVIVGDGPLGPSLRAKVRARGIESRVRFAGHIDAAYRLMQGFDLFVLPSGRQEAFGVVLLEAMLAHRPIVCSDAGGPGEIAADIAVTFKAGQVSSLASALQRALALSPEQRAALGESAYDRLLQHYTPAALSRELTNLGFVPDTV